MLRLRCPYCGKKNDTHRGMDEDERIDEVENPVSICWSCRQVSIFDQGTLRRPTEEEHGELARDPEVQRALSLMTEFDTVQELIEALRNY